MKTKKSTPARLLRQKRYREKNREKVKEYQRQYVEKNRKKHNAYHRKWKKANPEKFAAYQKKWREANPDYDRLRYIKQKKK